MGANVTNDTPYLKCSCGTKFGYQVRSVNSWTPGAWGGTGTTGNYTEVHKVNDQWSGSTCVVYIGAGFGFNSITLNWEAKAGVSIAYNGNGGSMIVNAVPCTTYTQFYGGTPPVRTYIGVMGNSYFATIPTRTGYMFNNWNTAANGTGTSYSISQSVNLSGNLTLYAQWSKTCDVTYNLNGGDSLTVTPFMGTAETGTVFKRTYSYNPVSIGLSSGFWGYKTPTKTGYQFMGWNTNAKGTGVTHYNGTSINLSENLTLYAKWEPLYDLTHNGNGGNFSSYNFTTGTSTSLPTYKASDTNNPKTLISNLWPRLTRDGYTFIGWNTKADGTGIHYNVGDSFKMTSTTATLYAEWIVQGTVTYNGNGATTADGVTTIYDGLYTETDKYTFKDNTFGDYQDSNKLLNKDDTTINKIKADTWTYTNEENTLHTFAGWSADSKANSYYSQSFINQPGDESSFADILKQFAGSTTAVTTNLSDKDRAFAINQKISSYKTAASTPMSTRNGFLYAVWDEYPSVSSSDRYLTIKQAQKGYVTEYYLLRSARIKDRETESFTLARYDADGNVVSIADGTPLTNSYILVSDYSTEDFTAITQEATISITYKVVDSFSNTTYKRINVHCVDTEPIEQLDFKFTRFISDKYYGLPEEEGGLHKNSVWMTNPEYVAELTAVLKEDATPEEVWVFTNEDKKAVQKYVTDNGLGKVESEDALQNFITQFSHCKQ